MANAQSIKETVEAQRDFFASGKTKPYEFRLNALKKLREAVASREEEIARAVYLDLHKPPSETYMCETGLVLEEAALHIKKLRAWMKERRAGAELAQFPSINVVSPEPYGVALIMSPWNYPVQLCLEPLIGAISAGNCALVKPSAYAKETSACIARMLNDIFPPEYVAVVEGGRAENQALLGERFDYIFFTGSVPVGKAVMEAASKNLTPVTLELGGKSPVIIDKTANIRVAARRVAFGKVLNAGQTCVEPDYLLIEECVREEFIEGFRAALREFFPDGDMSGMGRIISDKHYKEKKALLSSGTIAIGGGSDDETRFIEPTVLIDVPPDSPVMREEIFAPILPVLTWKSLDEAISFVSARPKPLALYLFTKDKEAERRVLEGCSFGGGCVNDTVIHVASAKMGFGGVGEAGMGSYHGKESFDAFTHYRSIVKKAFWLDLPMRYRPYSEKKDAIVRRFLG